jgi:DNA-binding CsgD family transcriptional regulator
MASLSPLAVLSKRELEIGYWYAKGRTYREISKIVFPFISPDTVRTHIGRIYDKLEIHNKVELHELFRNHCVLDEAKVLPEAIVASIPSQDPPREDKI